MSPALWSEKRRNGDVAWFSLIRHLTNNRDLPFDKNGDKTCVNLLVTPEELRVPVVGHGINTATNAAAAVIATANPKMPRGLPTRRGLQALALVLATAYATILLYQAVAPRQVRAIKYNIGLRALIIFPQMCHFLFFSSILHPKNDLIVSFLLRITFERFSAELFFFHCKIWSVELKNLRRGFWFIFSRELGQFWNTE